MDSQTRHDFLIMAITTVAMVVVATIAFAVISQLH
jgi:hypothetical protein